LPKYSVYNNPKDQLDFKTGMMLLSQLNDALRTSTNIAVQRSEAEKLMFRMMLFDSPYIISITPESVRYANGVWAPGDFIVVGRLCDNGDPTFAKISDEINPTIAVAGRPFHFDPAVLGRLPKGLLGGPVEPKQIVPQDRDELAELIDTAIGAFYVFSGYK
jgi:hypothetical protein